MTGLKIFATVFHILLVLLLLTGVILSLIGLVTPRWQTVSLAETGQIQHEGLWEDCVYTVGLGTQICNYKRLYYEEFDSRHRVITLNMVPHIRDPLTGWRLAVLILLAFGVIMGLFSTIFGSINVCVTCCGKMSCLKIMGVCWTVFTLLAAIFCGAAVALFHQKGYQLQQRMVQDVLNTYFKEFDRSFYAAAGGACCFAIAFLGALATTVAECYLAKRNQTPKIRTEYSYQYTAADQSAFEREGTMPVSTHKKQGTMV